MIILEGPDGSGKTTVLERLGYERRAFKALRAEVGGNEPGGTATSNFGGTTPAHIAYAQEILKARRENNHAIAFDRFHLSEHVYGPILRGKQELTEEDLNGLAIYLGRYHIPIILCLPPFEVTLKNVMTAGRERPAYQTEAFLRQAYDGFARLTPWAQVVYDFTRDPFPDLFDIRRRPNRERH